MTQFLHVSPHSQRNPLTYDFIYQLFFGTFLKSRTCLQLLLNTNSLIFCEEEVVSSCGFHIPVRETTETTTCCEIPLPPHSCRHKPSNSHLQDKTHWLACVCVSFYMRLIAGLCVCVYHCTSTSTFVFPACVCETLCASWVVSRPGYVAYCISS